MKDNLQETLGLTLNEARVYRALIKGVELEVASLTAETELPRTRIYEVLSSLSAKGFLEKRSGGDYRFIPPQESIPKLVQQIEKEHKKQTSSILDFGNYLQKVWNDSLAADLSPGVEMYSIEDVEPLFIQQLSQIKNRVWIAAADSSANMDMRKSGSTLASIYKESHDVRYLTSGKFIAERIRKGFEHFSPYKEMEIKIRSNEELKASYVLLDSVIYIFFFGGENIVEPTALRTASPQLVETFNWMFQRLWESAEPF